MADALTQLVEQRGAPDASDRMAKILADFDLSSLRKLERTRMMVRFGPALGLMGTLIPLSPALEGLAKGNVKLLSDNLRVAFSVTVLGLLIGAIAFAVSLVRDRMYAQDLSDLEYVATTLEPEPASAGLNSRSTRAPACGWTAPATRSTASSTCSTSGSCSRSRSCWPRCSRSTSPTC